MKSSDKRTRLMEAAEKLVQLQGFKQTTLADIAKEADVPLGNVFTTSKPKDDIGRVLIEHRTDYYRGKICEWDKLGEACKRILVAIKAAADSIADQIRRGCGNKNMFKLPLQFN